MTTFPCRRQCQVHHVVLGTIDIVRRIEVRWTAYLPLIKIQINPLEVSQIREGIIELVRDGCALLTQGGIGVNIDVQVGGHRCVFGHHVLRAKHGNRRQLSSPAAGGIFCHIDVVTNDLSQNAGQLPNQFTTKVTIVQIIIRQIDFLHRSILRRPSKGEKGWGCSFGQGRTGEDHEVREATTKGASRHRKGVHTKWHFPELDI